MLGKALASILRSRLGQYLDTQDLEVNVTGDIVLENVKLKESALRDAGLPLRYVLILFLTLRKEMGEINKL